MINDWRQTLSSCEGFDWDKGNLSKSWLKHRVNSFESEEVFFNRPLVITEDVQHSQKEERFFALGKTEQGRLLFIVFTIRRSLLRIISSRDMNLKEREVYQSYEKADSQIQK